MTEQLAGDEKSDGLDIVSIGKLYTGPWEKKYWSSSRGKDRYPYPVGYVALRANSGNTYKMAIFEGLKGPEFTISATDGQSCSGQTPDIAWDGFQKKSNVRLKFWRGKRFSCKIDGAELFGFKNPHVMRLLRGLKANFSPIAEKIMPSSIGNVQSEDTHEHAPDLQVNLVKTKTQCKGKKSKKRKEITVKSVSAAQHKKGKPEDQTQSDVGQHCRQGSEGNHNKEFSSTSLNLNENNKSDLSSVEDGLQFEKEKCHSVQEANNSIGSKDLISVEEDINSLKHQENLDVSNFNRTPGRTSFEIVDEKEEPPVQKDSQVLDNLNLYAPDTLDLTLDSICFLEAEIPKESTCTINDKLNSAQIKVSEKCVTESQTKDEMVIASGSDNSERCDSDPVGHEIANSMMTLLLPKALPLLKTFSRKKKKKDRPSAKSSEQMLMEKPRGKVHSPPNLFTENFKFGKQNEEVHSPRPDTSLAVPGLGDIAAVAPDSFENDHCGVVECSQDGQVQDPEKTDQNIVSMDFCTREGGHVHPNNQPGDEACHNETTTSQMMFDQDGHCVLEKSLPRDGKIVKCYNLENISPSRKDPCIHSNTPFSEKYPALKDVKISPCHLEVPSHQDDVLSPNYKVDSEVCEASLNCEGQPQASGYTELLEIQGHHAVDSLIPILQSQSIGQHDETETVDTDEEVKDDLCLNKLTKMALSNELEDIFKLVGCYKHSTSISMVMLRTKGNEVFICVLCGNLMESDRKLFIYKASIKGDRRECPSFIGHTTIISPILRTASGKQILLDSSSLQFTPDGNCLVLLNNIKAPCCREGCVNCQCSDCTTDCFEKNAVKVVEVKLGYVQVVCKMKTTNDVCSILVCEPNYLVAVEECGKMNLWTMNSSWSAPTEESYLPTSYCMPNCIVAMKRVPNFPALIVSHSAFGDFCLWDLTRKVLVSKFSAPTTSFLPFVPINIFRCPTQPLPTSDASRKKQVEDIMGETQRWSSETNNEASLPLNEDNLSLVLLVSSVSNLDLHDEYKYSRVGPVGSWSLALLAKGKLVSENALDSSATLAGASAGYGIVGTCDGSLYIWDIYMGTKIGYLSHCKGSTVSCLAVDDSSSGAFAVAVDDSELQVYAPGSTSK